MKDPILVCLLAYAMWKTLAGWMAAAGLGGAPRTLLYELAKIKSGDVALPAKAADGLEKTIRLRCVTEPDPAQNQLLRRLGLPLPNRPSPQPTRSNVVRLTPQIAPNSLCERWSSVTWASGRNGDNACAISLQSVKHC